MPSNPCALADPARPRRVISIHERPVHLRRQCPRIAPWRRVLACVRRRTSRISGEVQGGGRCRTLRPHSARYKKARRNSILPALHIAPFYPAVIDGRALAAIWRRGAVPGGQGDPSKVVSVSIFHAPILEIEGMPRNAVELNNYAAIDPDACQVPSIRELRHIPIAGTPALDDTSQVLVGPYVTPRVIEAAVNADEATEVVFGAGRQNLLRSHAHADAATGNTLQRMTLRGPISRNGDQRSCNYTSDKC